MRKIYSINLIFLLIISTVQIAFADQINLKNGDRITGKIVKKDADKITVETDFAGVIDIAVKNIENIIEDKTEAKTDDTKSDNQADKPQAAADVKTDADKAAVNPAENSEPVKKSFVNQTLGNLTTGWDGAANVGFSFTSGNSRTATFTAGIRAEKPSEKNKWTVYLNSLWNRNRVAGVNVTTSNALWGGVRYDRNLTKKWFAFVSYDFERDRPQKVNFRSVLGAGLGYHAIKNDRTELDLFSGAAWNRTWFVGAPNKSSMELLVGNTFKHKFNDRMKFQQGFTFYPNLTDGGEYRFVFDSTLSADVTKRIGWFVTVADRFNSAPLPTVEKNDFLFSTGLKWAFGKVK